MADKKHRRSSSYEDKPHPGMSPVVAQHRGVVQNMNGFDLNADEQEFIKALNAYKEKYNRPFLTWSEVLHVLRSLGYRKPE